MLVIMRKDSTESHCAAVEEEIRRMGFVPLPVPGENRTAICVTGNTEPVESAVLNQMPGVLECIPVTKTYKLVSREVHPDDTIVEVGSVRIGSTPLTFIAGPCSVETESRTLEVAQQVREAGAHLFRAGAYKPRTSPYSFQGLGKEGLLTLSRVRKEVGIPVVSEIVDSSLVDLFAEHVDIIQVGARNMQNFELLKKLGSVERPILLKRGISATFEEWLMAAEYLLAEGNSNVILCERGVRTFNNHSRNTLDLNIVPLVRKMTHLPVVVDPSHGVGKRDRVRHLARAGIAAGAHGLMMEVHTQPDTAYSDAQQTIDIGTFSDIVKDASILVQLENLFGTDKEQS